MTLEQAAFQFVRWALTEGSWRGADIDGAVAQEKAQELGLIVPTTYDPAKHESDDGAEEGDEWFVLAPALLAALAGEAA